MKGMGRIEDDGGGWKGWVMMAGDEGRWKGWGRMEGGVGGWMGLRGSKKVRRMEMAGGR
jgi:hypothetical protein